jgi:hypothetical protein
MCDPELKLAAEVGLARWIEQIKNKKREDNPPAQTKEEPA